MANIDITINTSKDSYIVIRREYEVDRSYTTGFHGQADETPSDFDSVLDSIVADVKKLMLNE